MTTKRKVLEYELTDAETAARDSGMDFPIAWACLFLVDKQSALAALCPEFTDEINGIVDWIKNGDPETRNIE